jgi:hypothetical protein
LLISLFTCDKAADHTYLKPHFAGNSITMKDLDKLLLNTFNVTREPGGPIVFNGLRMVCNL